MAQAQFPRKGGPGIFRHRIFLDLIRQSGGFQIPSNRLSEASIGISIKGILWLKARIHIAQNQAVLTECPGGLEGFQVIMVGGATGQAHMHK